MRYNQYMLKKYLKENNISIYSLSKNSGVPYSTLNDLVNHKILIENFKIGPARKISEALGLYFEEFCNLCSYTEDYTVTAGTVEGKINVKGRNYYVTYVLNNELHCDRLCMVNSVNDIFVNTMAEWAIENRIDEERFREDYELLSDEER